MPVRSGTSGWQSRSWRERLSAGKSISAMRSFIDLDATFHGQPRELGAVLARIDTGRGREQLFENRLPEVLKQLSENARIASITASNAIDAVIVDPERARKIADGPPRFRNRSEREFAGYRDAIDGLTRTDQREPLSVPLLLHLHRQLFEHAGGRGGHLKTDQNLIVSYESGHREFVSTPPSPAETEFLLCAQRAPRAGEDHRRRRRSRCSLAAGVIAMAS